MPIRLSVFRSEALGRARLSIRPDYLVVVEREIYCHHQAAYTSLAEWNDECTRVHAEIFSLVRRDLGRLIGWVQEHFEATVYEDAYSPFCLQIGSSRPRPPFHPARLPRGGRAGNLLPPPGRLYQPGGME